MRRRRFFHQFLAISCVSLCQLFPLYEFPRFLFAPVPSAFIVPGRNVNSPTRTPAPGRALASPDEFSCETKTPPYRLTAGVLIFCSIFRFNANAGTKNRIALVSCKFLQFTFMRTAFVSSPSRGYQPYAAIQTPPACVFPLHCSKIVPDIAIRLMITNMIDSRSGHVLFYLLYRFKHSDISYFS